MKAKTEPRMDRECYFSALILAYINGDFNHIYFRNLAIILHMDALQECVVKFLVCMNCSEEANKMRFEMRFLEWKCLIFD